MAQDRGWPKAGYLPLYKSTDNQFSILNNLFIYNKYKRQKPRVKLAMLIKAIQNRM